MCRRQCGVACSFFDNDGFLKQEFDALFCSYHTYHEQSWLLCVVCVGQKRHAPPPLPSALTLPPLQLAAPARHSMGDDSPWSSVSPAGLPATQFPQSHTLCLFTSFCILWILNYCLLSSTNSDLRLLFVHRWYWKILSKNFYKKLSNHTV